MKITKFSRTLIIALALGNSSVLLRDGILVITNDDLDYLNYIKSILKKNGINVTDIYETDNELTDEYLSNFNLKKRYIMRTYKHKFMKIYMKMLYHRTIKRKWLNRFYPLHLSLWFLEIGKFINKQLELKTDLDEKDNQLIINYFKERWNIDFALNDKKLICNTYNAKKLIKIIDPYLPQIKSGEVIWPKPIRHK